MSRQKSIKYPVADIAARLLYISERVCEPHAPCLCPAPLQNGECECGWCDVRLTIEPNGSWYVTSGPVDYDAHMAHSAGQISTREPLSLKHAQLMARVLINQAADFVADDPTWGHPVAYAMTRAERERMRGTFISSAYDLT